MSIEGGGWTRFLRYSDPNSKTKLPNSVWNEAIKRAAAGGIKQWLVKTYSSPADDSAKNSKWVNAWVLNLATKVQGSKFTHFQYKKHGGCNAHRYSGASWVSSAKLVSGSHCTSLSHTSGRELWGEYTWCNHGGDSGQMWFTHCGAPTSGHLLLVNHDYNYGPRYQNYINAPHGAGKWGNYDEDGVAFEFFYR